MPHSPQPALRFPLTRHTARQLNSPGTRQLLPWDHSDLKPDPAMTYGVLPNGVRYVILPHQTPKGRVSLYLDVQAGSYFETPEQLGYAALY